MKRTTLFFMLYAFIFAANAQVLYDETFDYQVGERLNGQGGWTEIYSSTPHLSGEGRIITSPALSYSDATGPYALSSMGNAMLMYDIQGSTENNYAFKPFTETPLESGVVYLTSMVYVNANLGPTHTEICGLSDGSSPGPKVMIKKLSPSSTFAFGTTRAAASTAAYKYGQNIFDVLTTYLVVLKYDFATQTSSIFVNPELGSTTEPATPEIFDNSSDTKRSKLNNMWFRNQKNRCNHTVGGLRVSTSWAAAVALPAVALDYPVVGVASNITNNSFTANWTPVANAVGYEVAVYSQTTPVKMVIVSGQSIASVAIKDLKSNTKYNYTVIAKGDGLAYASSGASALSAEITTLGLSVPVVADATGIGNEGFTANWLPVANASGYDVMLYQGSSVINTVTVSAENLNYIFTALRSGTTYKYSVIAKGDGISHLHSTPSDFISVTTNTQAVNAVNTDFGDGSWGPAIPAPASNLPLTGAFPTAFVNGFELIKSVLYGVTSTGPNGQTYVNGIRIDRGGAVNLPVINALEELEIHILGGDQKNVHVKEYNEATFEWELVGPGNGSGIGIYKLAGTRTNIFVIKMTRVTPVKLKIENGDTGSMTLNKVISRQTASTAVELSVPTGIGEATNIIPGGFTASWSPVANAVGYIVAVLNDGAYLNKNFFVEGGTTSSYNVAGLGDTPFCSYQVAAVGDGVNYSNSLLSEASAVFAVVADPSNLHEVNKNAANVWVSGKNILASETGSFQVYNLQGSLLLTAKNTDNINSNLNGGLYLIRFTNTAGKTSIHKVIIREGR